MEAIPVWLGERYILIPVNTGIPFRATHTHTYIHFYDDLDQAHLMTRLQQLHIHRFK